jgi:hypothetical protein
VRFFLDASLDCARDDRTDGLEHGLSLIFCLNYTKTNVIFVNTRVYFDFLIFYIQ